MSRFGQLLPLVFEDEGHLHGHPVFLDFSVLRARLVLDYVKSGDAAQGSLGPRQPLANGGVKALGRAAVIFVTLATAIPSFQQSGSEHQTQLPTRT